MERLAQGDDSRSPARTRGRPGPGIAAQINEEILEAACDLFLSLGYERTSMAMVTKAAGVSKTTLYARYANKADLFRASVTYTVGRIANQALSPAESRTYELVPGLTKFANDAIRISLSPVWSSYERLVYSEGFRFPGLAESIAARVHVGVQTVSRFLRDCAEREGASLLDPDRVATIYVMALRGFYTAAVLRGSEPADAEIAGFVDNLVAFLLAARASW
jgi:AcrR family transcriptional regulator